MATFEQTSLRGKLIGGKYVVGEVIGSGGMGIVYEATHIELKVPCALKVVSARAADSNQFRRLLREARVLATLHSAHAVKVLDAGRLPDGAPFLVMERLRGEPLSELLGRTGPVAPTRALAFAWQICEAVKEAHERGIIHRDLKPSNVFVVKEGTIKVLDFGLARRLGGQEHDSTVTASEFAGTPRYMSPEQIRASAELTPATDIWSIGVLLFEMLTGRLPFEGSNPAALLASIVADPETRLRQLLPDAAPELDRLLADCLEKNPTDRPRDAAQLQARLAAVSRERQAPSPPASTPNLALVTAPEEAAPTWTSDQPDIRRKNRRPTRVHVLIAAGSVILTLTLAAAFGQAGGMREAPEPEVSVAKSREQREKPHEDSTVLISGPAAPAHAPALDPEPKPERQQPVEPTASAQRAAEQRAKPRRRPVPSSEVLEAIESRH